MNWNLFYKSSRPFLPLLVLYIFIVLIFSSETMVGDESRYLRYATNITNGFYTDADNPELSNGPGYPLVLAPFLALNANHIFLELLNVFLVFGGVLFFNKTLQLFTKKKYALYVTFIFGLYPPLIRFIPYLYTEPLSVLLMCALIYYVCKLLQADSIKWKYVIGASFSLGFLVLVKLIFFYVVLLSALLLMAAYVLYRKKPFMKPALILLGGFLFITPYLVHTYFLTGKLFYMGTGGGEIVYFRSTPFEGEWGNWFSKEAVLNENLSTGEDAVYSDLTALRDNHREFFENIDSLTYMERDSVFKARGIQNMKSYPGKYLKNTVSNVGRLLFHFPFSYRNESMAAYGYMIPNMFIVVFFVLSLIPLFLTKKKIPLEIRSVLIFILIYGCLIVLLDGRGRNFIIMVPGLILFIVYSLTNHIHISLKESRH